MAIEKKQILDFEIDKLTNSIEFVSSGESYKTEVVKVTLPALKEVIKKNGWFFDWKYELKLAGHDVYKLVLVDDFSTIQGLISLQVKDDHVYMHLVESAPFNKGNNKLYAGVPGNLVAFACLLSFEKGFDGNVSFISKSQLVNHYIESLGAIHFGGRLMIIEGNAAKKLIDKYFKNETYEK